MKVEIHRLVNGEDQLAGTLSLVNGRIAADADVPLLRNIVGAPVYDYRAKRPWLAQQNPEEFLRALPLQYRSAYLRARLIGEEAKSEKRQKSGDRPSAHMALSSPLPSEPEVHYGTESPGPGWIESGPMKWVKTPSAGTPKIAVVGGGPAGLFTAYILQQRLPEASISLFESSGRLGGKVMTAAMGDGTPYEAGVAELYDYKGSKEKNSLRALIEDVLGLATQGMSGGGVVLRGKVLRDRNDLEREFGKATRDRVDAFHKKMVELMPLKKYALRWQPEEDHPWADKTFRDCICAECGDDPVACEYIETAVASDLATESYTCNGLNGVKNVLLDNDDYMQLYHIQGGIERLVTALASRLRAGMNLESRVVAVEKVDGDKYKVHYQHYGQELSEDFDCVFLAMPNHWLAQVRFPDAKLKEAIDAFVRHYDLPAHYFRVTLLFDKRWWDRFGLPGDFWMMDAFCPGCCVYDESARWRRQSGKGHILSVLIGGQSALLLCSANLTVREIAERVIDGFPADWRADARQSLLECRVDSYAGSINAQPGGWSPEELRGEHQPEPKSNPGIYLVCDALFDSTLNAALISANTAVELLLEEMDVAGEKATDAIENLQSVGKAV